MAFLRDIRCNNAMKEPLFMELANESLLQKLSKEIFSIPQCENSRSETVSTYLHER